MKWNQIAVACLLLCGTAVTVAEELPTCGFDFNTPRAELESYLTATAGSPNAEPQEVYAFGAVELPIPKVVDHPLFNQYSDKTEVNFGLNQSAHLINCSIQWVDADILIYKHLRQLIETHYQYSGTVTSNKPLDLSISSDGILTMISYNLRLEAGHYKGRPAVSLFIAHEPMNEEFWKYAKLIQQKQAQRVAEQR